MNKRNVMNETNDSINLRDSQKVDDDNFYVTQNRSIFTPK
jgi:hypothetical protein